MNPLIKLAQRLYSPAPILPRPTWPVKSQTSTWTQQELTHIWEAICSRPRSYSKPFTVNWYYGLSFLLYPGNELCYHLFVDGYYEPNETYLLTQLLEPGMTFIDVGANLGVYSLLAAHLVGNSGNVMALEPSKREFDRLLQQIKANNLTHINAKRLALGNRVEKTTLKVAPYGAEGHNTLGNFAYKETKVHHREKVQLTTLDQLTKDEQLTRIDFIKLDIEGSEIDALSGGTATIKKYRPVILIEVFENALRGQGRTTVDIEHFFKKINYTFYRFDPFSGLPIKSSHLDGNLGENVLAVPASSPWRENFAALSPKYKNKPPLVSIVTPCFNSEKYIAECIESVLSQDYPFVEHIIYDGASTDNTVEIIKKHAGSTFKRRIRWYSEPDNGQSDGLNKAIQKAQGDILLVLNADDMLLPHAASWAIKNMAKYPQAAVIYGDTYIINEASEIIRIYAAHEYDFEKLLCVELVPPAQAAFIRRVALEKVGFWADKDLDTCPDYEMWVRLALKFPMQHVFGVVTKYRHHDVPLLDSKQLRTTKRALAAKKLVMDRVFNDPKTPANIKKLRRRAYGSLYSWSAATANELKEYSLAFEYKLKAFWFSPDINNFKRIVLTWKNSPLQYFTVLVKTMLTSLKHNV